jgi:2-amino-4-hydroxy-6-hydroxymethyldihydropteridine diphosphokinase
MKCGIALGSNLGDRFRHLQEARRLLAQQSGGMAASPVYQTSPVDCPPGSLPFLNCVVEIDWPGSVEDLHALARKIESQCGRGEMRAHHAPRPIDLDLLYCGDEHRTDPQLQLPHPRLHVRRFVLEPLADLRPGLILPGFSRTVADLLSTLTSPEPPLRLFVRHWQ